MRSRIRYMLLAVFLLSLAACQLDNDEARIVYVTATPVSAVSSAGAGDVSASQPVVPTTDPGVQVPTAPPVVLSSVPAGGSTLPTADPPRRGDGAARPRTHTIQSGDTLIGIALTYGMSLETLLSYNAEITDPNLLTVGQVVNLPPLPEQVTPDRKLIPDSRLVRAPGSPDFDIATFIQAQPGYIRIAADQVQTRQADGSTDENLMFAAQIIERVSLEFSVDPRLLLALLEYRAGWLSNPNPDEALRNYPLIAEEDTEGIDREGMYRQLAWTANQLNAGYYGWKYRDLLVLEFSPEQRFVLSSGLNAGTVALQYFLSLNSTQARWQRDVSAEGLYATYFGYFGDPFAGAVEPLVPPGLVQPAMTLPFAAGQTWFYTGGWHGGWGSGSAWAAIDLAPPDDPSETGGVLCYTSAYDVTAVAPGVIARSENGVVVLDLDGDGDESTGWSVLYLHLATDNRIAAGTQVQPGDPVGRASCEGGFSTATHLHIARRYNGEWLPADCSFCQSVYQPPPFNLGGWSVVGLKAQEYQGFLQNAIGEQRVAEQGRLTPENRVSW